MSLSDPIRYPAGITPHGEYHLLRGKLPCASFHAHDGSIEFRIQGGLAAPFQDPDQPAVSVSSLDGLLAPWQFVTQKGATQHGVTTVAVLGDPIEITAEIELLGPTAKATQRLVRDWIAANERMKTGELAIFTQQLGRWWVDARWGKTPPNKIIGAFRRRQPFTQTWTVDSSFWRTFNTTDSFRLTFDTNTDSFDVVETDLGAGWDVEYSGTGEGYIHADGDQAAWQDDPEEPALTGGRGAACRRVGYTSAGDNQVVEIVLGAFPGWGFPLNGEVHIWGRLKTTGDAGDDGVRAEIRRDRVRLSYFVAGVETILKDERLAIPPTPGERFSLICGVEGSARTFKIQRGGIEILSTVESGTGSQVGASYRAAGFGLHAGPAAEPEDIPPNVATWSTGVNASANQYGFVKLINIGDQPMWPRFTCFGPGTFVFGNGPGSTDYVRFGPLLPNQVMQVNSDREARPVVDMTSVAPAPGQYNQYQQALNDFIGFATSGNVTLLFNSIRSIFGVIPPQAHPYSLLAGAFSNPVPAKSPGRPAQSQYISVGIEGGNASSMIVAAGTPLRRYPL